ncbi:MAG: tetratricopeptide repeat protein [Isosphaerales bacterium]
MNDPSPLEAIFFAALEKGSRQERAAYLDLACAGDPDLRQHIEKMLAAQAQAGSFLEQPAPSPVATVDEQPISEGAGRVIGPYKLLQPIGEGGMGTVYMAEQTAPVRRLVALKVIKAGMDSRQVLARFGAERQALALMDHPNIAKVLDAGTTDDGRPYFVMELVKGVPITRFCDERRLSTRERLELAIPVCQAVQHAHQKGVIHRDLKPSNILVALYDDKPVPKIIDFGVAKATGPRLTDQTLYTEFGSVVGTLEYMSPEQAQLNQLDIDTRSDVYSLGVLLYELLTGSPPLNRKRLKEAGFLEVLRVIREEEPPRPSMRLSTTEELPSIAACRGIEPRRLSGLMRGELDWIVMKALEKDRNRRYQTANELARDVEHYLHDEPVLACPPSAWYRFGKFTRRNRGPLTMGAVVTAALLLVAGSIGWLARERAAEQADIVHRAENSLTAARTLLADSKPALARQKLAEARGEIAGGRAARGSLAAQIEALEVELERRQSFLNLLDRAHDEEIVDGLRQPTRMVPFTLGALAQYEVLEREDWRTRLEQGVLGKDQVEEVRRLGYEQLLWLADDVLRRKQDQRSGQPLSPGAAAQAAAAYLQKAETAWPPTQAFYRLRAQAREALGQKELARADFELADRTPPTMAWDYYLQGQAAYAARDRDNGIEALRAALRVEPRHFFSLLLLGYCLCDLGRGPEDFTAAEIILTACIMMRPDYAHVHDCRGIACRKLKQWDKALADHSKAIELDPTFALTWFNRGWAYAGLKQWDKALADHSKAIELDPKLAHAWTHRGVVYNELGQWDKALADHSRAIELDPKFASAWNNRGWAYAGLKQLDKALADYSKAIELDPKLAHAWNHRGVARRKLKQWDKAIADFSKAIELDPSLGDAWTSRGNVYSDLKQWDKALADHSKAIELDPKGVAAWNNRGLVYTNLKQWDKAIADCSKVIDLQADYYAEANCSLAHILRSQGQLSASLDFYKRGHASGSKRKDWRCPSAQWVADAERLVRLEAKLADVLGGKATAADNVERLGLAEVCGLQRRHVAAARLYADVFTADPKLAEDLKAGHRYNAACFAALAASGQGTDAGKLDDQEHRRLRQQASGWLRADLDLWSKRLEGGKPEDRQVGRAMLQHWQRDSDLAGVRDPQALNNLSAQEQEAWRKLWADVAELLKKAGNAK